MPTPVRPQRRVLLRVRPLEDRLTPSVPSHAAVNDHLEVYQWAIINEMRANPSAFADKLQALDQGSGSAWGFAANDPVWNDVRRIIKSYDGVAGKSSNGSTWYFSGTLALLRSQSPLGPLALDPQLSQGAFGHVNWMTSHAYGHSVDIQDQYNSSQWGVSDQGKGIAGFPYHPLGSYPGWTPDFVNLDKSQFYHQVGSTTWYAWGEDIGNPTFTNYAIQNAYNSDHNQNLFYQRMALYDVLGYLIDWGNGSYTDTSGNYHPADGHLRNLLSHDQGDLPENSTSSQPKNKEIGNENSVGMDLFLYTQANPSNLSGVADADASTHRLAYRGRPDGQGGIITFLMYRDANGDGFYTPGEERNFSVTMNGKTPAFTLAPTAGAASVLVTVNGTYNFVFTDSSTGESVKQSVTVNNGNVAVTVVDAGGHLTPTITSANIPRAGLNLTDSFGGTIGTATPTPLNGSGSFSATTTLRSGAVDVFALTAAAGSKLTATTGLPAGAASPVDTYLRLFDASGNQLAADDDGGGNFYSQLTYTFAAGGTYYVAVSGGGNTSYDPTRVAGRTASPSGDYRLEMQLAAPPPAPAGGGPSSGVNDRLAVGAGPGGDGVVTVYDRSGSAVSTLSVFPGFTGGVRTATADVNGDGTPDVVAGTGPGAPTQVKVLDGKTGAVLFTVQPFEASFTGGVYVAAADLNGDGKAEIVVTPDEGGGPVVVIYDGAQVAAGADGDSAQLARFLGIDDPNFRGGARAALADVNGDGTPDLLVAAGFGGGPRLATFDGRTLTSSPAKLFGDFFVFEQTLRNGVFVAGGDLNGDGFGDVIVGGGPGGGPRVFALSGKDLLGGNQTQLANFFGGDPASTGGIRVAAKDLDGDGRADLVVGAGEGAGPRVTAYAGKDVSPDGTPPELFAFDSLPGFAGGVFVG